MILFSPHALDMLAERSIERVWVERTVREPDVAGADPLRPDRIRAFRAIPERGGRVLRVVYVQAGEDIRIITAFFDRSRTPTP